MSSLNFLHWLIASNHTWSFLMSCAQVSLLVPVCYLLFWVLLLGFSLHSEPVVCGVGLVIMLTGVPVYFLGVYWKDKPKCIYNFIGKVNIITSRVVSAPHTQVCVLRNVLSWCVKSKHSLLNIIILYGQKYSDIGLSHAYVFLSQDLATKFKLTIA